MAWKLTVRVGPRVERERFPGLDAALDALQTRASQLATDARRAPVDVRVRRFEPVQQVTARIELAGPQRLVAAVRAGLDVRGDGSLEAYRGRVRRTVLVPQANETPLQALRREMRAAGR
jgi:hypothetical protein